MISTFLTEVSQIAGKFDVGEISLLVDELVSLRKRKGRLYLAGLGGSAANCAHAAADLQNLCDIQTYNLTGNVAYLTAIANDVGWNHIFDGYWFEENDALFVMSVGGGTLNVSFPLVLCIDRAKARGMKILGIVGRDGGYTKKHGDAVVVIPTVNPKRVTPLSEAFQVVLLHLLVSHPDLQLKPTRW